MLSPPISVFEPTLFDLGGCGGDSGSLVIDTTLLPKAATTTDDGSGQAELHHHQYLNSPLSSPTLTSHSSTSTASSATSASYLSPLPSDYEYLPTPAPDFTTPFPGLSPEILSAEWTEHESRIRESPEPYESGLSGAGAGTVDMRYVLESRSRVVFPYFFVSLTPFLFSDSPSPALLPSPSTPDSQ